MHVEEFRYKIIARGDLPHVDVDEQLEMLLELTTFPLGEFLIRNRGLNGYWIDYIHNAPTRIGNHGVLSQLEEFILSECPIMLATRERYYIFKREIQKHMVSGCAMASCPSGVMSDLLLRDGPFPAGIRLYGIDIDQNSLDEAQEQVGRLGNPPVCEFIQGDAWQFILPEPVDFITTNGLVIYVEDDLRVMALYRQFYNALRPGGVMLASTITPPSTWKMDCINPEAARVQRILLNDILEVSWWNYRSVETTREQLEGVGFTNITFLHDAASMYPSVLATRP